MSTPERDALRYPGRVDLVDVSSVQATIDWPRVARAGFSGAIVKVTEGVDGVDPRGLANVAGAHAAGLLPLVYHYFHVSEDPERQAESCWQHCGDVAPFRVCMDLEDAPTGMAPVDVAKAGLAFATALESRFGRPPCLYTYPWFLATRLAPALVADAELAEAYGRLRLWMAWYGGTQPWVPGPTQGPTVPHCWETWTIHQYSGDGGYRVPGVPGDCDRDLFNGSLADFRLFCGLSSDVVEMFEASRSLCSSRVRRDNS